MLKSSKVHSIGIELTTHLTWHLGAPTTWLQVVNLGHIIIGSLLFQLVPKPLNPPAIYAP